jgi:hypothetical protein
MVFTEPADQRLHYQSDLHRFNLRRQAANLPPITAQVFQDKVSRMSLPLLPSTTTIRVAVTVTAVVGVVLVWC